MNKAGGSRIFYTKPSITEREIAYATDAVSTGWGARCYEYIDRFERDFASHLGSRFAIATSSATGALHLGLAGLGIGPGDEVILCDSNWIASVAPVIHLGATPVLVDADRKSWCLDPRAVEAAVTERTKAILAVHLYGNMCDMNALGEIARRHSIALVEDAAEAIGSEWRGRKAGSMGAFGAFSFHGTKTLTTGEGGMFVTSDEALFERVLTLSNHGRARGETRQFWPERIGFKYKMSNVQAAIGCAQLERVDELMAAKRRIFDCYREALAGLPLSLNPEPPGTRNGYWMPTAVVDEDVPFDRGELLARFKADEIDGRVFFWPLSQLPAFRPVPSNTTSRWLSTHGINLPSYHDLLDSDIARVAGHVRGILEGSE